MAEPVAMAALILDAAIGWPHCLYIRIGHPVGLFARIINACARCWNRPEYGELSRRFLGVATMAVLVISSGGAAWLLQTLIISHAGSFGWLLLAICAWPALAQRSLYTHVRPVARSLVQGDIENARKAVSMIVGRDTEALDQAGIARAAIESLAESFCDGIVAPLFWLLIGGLPGLWAYKAINTADSVIGHREEPWSAFGWAAARVDDVANLLPARIGGILLCLVAGRGWRIMLRDARKHASPNAGWTEAAMAGALGLRIAGPVSYDGAWEDKSWIGTGSNQAGPHDIDCALRIYLRACAGLWIVSGGLAWVL
ncbi:cobalamin biosynthesis protein CobD [Croceicoccus estronivorus]|uniref:adenosylcobinamide-phosphate synthase CbiB n=1 Tax=Croceicoccus estronivorus TaxID=1172626 RepID=UPI0008354B7A|nr:adenosylcobinamide-phosphate synthase CbiB [Croceicoccus estronivorus]OCC24183.1 cobalamin biosynthesis protein CobD [Croceicoccus estronivorus]